MQVKVLLTGGGGAAAVSFMKAVKHLPVEIHVADMDAYAAGFYLVPAKQRLLIPSGDSSNYVDTLLFECEQRKIDVLVPTVDCELTPIAKASHLFEKIGTKLLLAEEKTFDLCLDKWKLVQVCSSLINTPETAIFNDDVDLSGWTFPLIIKPRVGSGSRGIRLINNSTELGKIDNGSHLLIQEYLPGAEYSVDVLASKEGEVVATVPRERLKIDSGVAVTGRTVFDKELMEMAKTVALAIGLRYVANIQFKRDKNGKPSLLEVNPRFPGTMPLTVASGVNMPALSLQNLLGKSIPLNTGIFNEIAVVRYWQEQITEIHEIADLIASRPTEESCEHLVPEVI